MSTTATDELAASLRLLIDGCEDGSTDAGIEAICRAIVETGVECEIEEDDDGPEDDGETALWVVSTHRLLIGGESVAEWTRCSTGTYGDRGQQHLSDTWTVSEDTTNGDTLPDAVAVALGTLGLKDDCPDVPEPDAPGEDSEGEYAVLQKNDYAVSDGRDEWKVVARYATEEDARAACDASWRAFSAATTQGSYGPEWCVGALVDTDAGRRWEPLTDEGD